MKFIIDEIRGLILAVASFVAMVLMPLMIFAIYVLYVLLIPVLLILMFCGLKIGGVIGPDRREINLL